MGGFATAAHYLWLVVAVQALHWPAWWGAASGAVIGAQVAFAGNRRYTFEHRGALGPAWLKFQGTAVVGAVVSATVVALGVRLGWHYLLAQALATLIGLVLTFAINRAWTFR